MINENTDSNIVIIDSDNGNSSIDIIGDEDDKKFSNKNRTKADLKVFKTAVKVYKKEHPGDLVSLNILSNDMVAMAVSAWPNVPRSINRSLCYEMKTWDMVWYPKDVWRVMAMVPSSDWDAVRMAVIGNHLVYPDGELPVQVRDALSNMGRQMAGGDEDE